MSRERAEALVEEKISNINTRKHMMAVSAIMEDLADRLGGDRELWSLTGLLHDIDYEAVGGDMKRHGLVSAEMLEGLLPEESLHAIRAHNTMTGVEVESLLDKALIIADAVSGLIVASALVMPHKKLSEVKVSTLKKKFKDKSFARSVDRDKIMMCKEVGMELEEFLELSLRSLQRISDKLGL